MIKWIKEFSILFFLIFFDAVSKYLTFLYVPKMRWFHGFYPYGGIGILKFFNISVSLNYIENKGAAWGILSSHQDFLLFLRILVVLAILVYLIFFDVSFKKGFGYLLVCSGAIGNILDYFFYGHVIDMIHIKFYKYSFPIFNIADICITLGIVFILFTSFKIKKKI